MHSVNFVHLSVLNLAETPASGHCLQLLGTCCCRSEMKLQIADSLYKQLVCFFSKHQLVKPVTCPMKLKAVEQMILERNNFDFLQTPYLTEVSYEQVTSTIIIKCCHM